MILWHDSRGTRYGYVTRFTGTFSNDSKINRAVGKSEGRRVPLHKADAGGGVYAFQPNLVELKSLWKIVIAPAHVRKRSNGATFIGSSTRLKIVI
ncbi:hypothetical protein DICVIV_10326 [Dictyocaulus viviparus]|uniref:Uncharacterized protein n=1 Tax=Dictyocaulus viviparus TaxID=29172 RepID=A0A0D8XIQ5_DICVI|nr:hypothetical protein DICVIV_10326 [Dictyocaulus viviparus]